MEAAEHLGHVRQRAERRQRREAEERLGARAEGVEYEEEGVPAPVEEVDVDAEEGEDVEGVPDHLGDAPCEEHGDEEGVGAGLVSARSGEGRARAWWS